MDNMDKILAVFEQYKDVSVNKVFESWFEFSTHNANFVFCINDDTVFGVPGTIFILQSCLKQYPHIMIHGQDHKIGDIYFCGVCLYDHIDRVFSLLSLEDKVNDMLDRLIELLTLSSSRIEKEYHNEFLFYWNTSSKCKEDTYIYVNDDTLFHIMYLYTDKKGHRWVFSNGVRINNYYKKMRETWAFAREMPCFHIPIVDMRGIKPPTVDSLWGGREIREIIYGREIAHIDTRTYQQIKSIKTNKRCVGIAFSFHHNNVPVTVFCTIDFQDSSTESLFIKLCNKVSSVYTYRSVREDYAYCNTQIGNNNFLLDKKLLLIGAGSIGSNFAEQIIKAGLQTITICDGDVFETVNTSRHILGSFYRGVNKATCMQYYLEQTHPEIVVNAIECNMTAEELARIAPDYDVVISTIGCSDAQLKFNYVLHQNKCSTPIFFIWLEAGGKNGHVMFMNASEQGCFQCLFTDSTGKWMPNRINQNDLTLDPYAQIRNGCGGSRVPYGNNAVIRIVYEAIIALEQYFSDKLKTNCVISIDETSVSEPQSIIEQRCPCCGK